MNEMVKFDRPIRALNVGDRVYSASSACDGDVVKAIRYLGDTCGYIIYWHKWQGEPPAIELVYHDSPVRITRYEAREELCRGDWVYCTDDNGSFIGYIDYYDREVYMYWVELHHNPNAAVDGVLYPYLEEEVVVIQPWHFQFSMMYEDDTFQHPACYATNGDGQWFSWTKNGMDDDWHFGDDTYTEWVPKAVLDAYHHQAGIA